MLLLIFSQHNLALVLVILASKLQWMLMFPITPPAALNKNVLQSPFYTYIWTSVEVSLICLKSSEQTIIIYVAQCSSIYMYPANLWSILRNYTLRNKKSISYNSSAANMGVKHSLYNRQSEYTIDNPITLWKWQ